MKTQQKTNIFTGLSIVGGLLISAFFIQTAAAQGGKTSQTKPLVCKVKKTSADFFVTATEKTIKLKKGTALSWTIPDLHQGLIVVQARVGKKWIQGEIKLDDTTCN